MIDTITNLNEKGIKGMDIKEWITIHSTQLVSTHHISL